MRGVRRSIRLVRGSLRCSRLTSNSTCSGSPLFQILACWGVSRWPPQPLPETARGRVAFKGARVRISGSIRTQRETTTHTTGRHQHIYCILGRVSRAAPHLPGTDRCTGQAFVLSTTARFLLLFTNMYRGINKTDIPPCWTCPPYEKAWCRCSETAGAA